MTCSNPSGLPGVCAPTGPVYPQCQQPVPAPTVCGGSGVNGLAVCQSQGPSVMACGSTGLGLSACPPSPTTVPNICGPAGSGLAPCTSANSPITVCGPSITVVGQCSFTTTIKAVPNGLNGTQPGELDLTLSCPNAAGVAGVSSDTRASAAAKATQCQPKVDLDSLRQDLINTETSAAMRAADLLRRDAAEYTHIVCSETGKPIKEAKVEVERGTQTLIAAAHEARQLCGEVVPMEFSATGKGRMAITVREPLGVIGCITPFNVPLNLALHKVAPALAGGNAVIHKPATKTPLSGVRLARTMEQAGVPKGAYNVITGSGAQIGMALAEHPDVAMLTFTGSPEVGRAIKSRSGFKKVTLELGNNSAVIIEPGSDLSTAVARTIQGAFSHSG